MAINFTVSYTFSPNTTISSSQVNTNTSDNANVWTGLEAKTKSFSNLKVDATPASSTEVAIKSYVDTLMTWRRPVLQYASTTTVQLETGLTGTSGQAAMLFPDGNYRTDSTSSHLLLDDTRVASLTGTKQSGIDTGTVGGDTIYAVYAVKASDNSTDFVVVMSLTPPNQTGFSTLNSNFGTNSWVFLGYILNGAVATQTTQICHFTQIGNMTLLSEVLATANVSGSGRNKFGVRMANTASAQLLTSSPTAGTVVGTNIPTTAKALLWTVVVASGTAQVYYGDNNVSASAGTVVGTMASIGGIEETASFWLPSNVGAGVANSAGSNVAMSIMLAGWIDGALGVGANPLL